MAMFKGFKPQGLQKIANSMGYTGSLEGFDSYLQQNPDKQNMMNMYTQRAVQMAQGGAVRKMRVGGVGTTNLGSGQFARIPEQMPNLAATNVGEIKSMVQQPPKGSGEIPQGVSYTTADVFNDTSTGQPMPLSAQQIDKQIAGQGIFATPAQLQGMQRPRFEANVGIGSSQPKQTQAYVPTLGEGQGQIPAYGTADEPRKIGEVATTLAQTGAIPVGAVTQPELIQREAGQFIDPTTGQLTTAPTTATATAGTAQAGAPTDVTSTQMEAVQATPAIETALQANLAAQTDPNDPRAQITAAQQTASSVGDLTEAQGNATLMQNPIQREIQQGELIDGVADAEKAAKFTEQIDAATATPTEKATVQGQLASLTANFDASNPPAWAAGTLRAVQAKMAQRGLGASSMAGQAMIQGALESALPIAQADANIQAQFETQNLSNRQQRAMLAAQQRATFLGQEFDQAFQARVRNAATIGDIANMNFTAEQNIAMENSRAVNTMNLNNLNNRQAMVMAEAAALADLDRANLSNLQQAAVQNAQNFLQMDMANLSNEQQTQLFNAQAINQSLLTDQAATNAARQFNATSQNQVDQFMANLANQVAQFNVTQTNAQNQFNAGELNTLARFNTEIINQRDQFNAQNQLAIAQNNAVWRREIATADTVAINRANELNAKAVLDVSNQQYNNLWNQYADTIEWAWKSAEQELDRINALAIAEVSKEAQEYASNATKSAAGKSALGTMIGTLGGLAMKFG